MRDTLKIYVAAHKKVKEYVADDCYEILHVGAECHDNDLGYTCDNTGDNISIKNPMYCELTGLYWMWKNAPETKYIGLCHYRRYPSAHSYAINLEQNILKKKEILKLLENADILMPQKLKKTELNSLCKNEMELNQCREYRYIKKAILNQCPEYVPSLNKVFMDTEMCFGNIFVLSQKKFNYYCEWLFNLLFEIENQIKEDADEIPREYGYLSEWMLNVWVEHNKLKVRYIPSIFTEEKHNWKFYAKLIRERLGA